jgi:hypothetical protein
VKRGRQALLAIALSLPVSIRTADAVVLELAFAGEVSSVDPQLSAGFSIGQPMAGSVTYDLATPDVEPSAMLGIYANAGSGAWQLGAYEASDALVTVSVGNDLADLFQASGGNPSGPDVGSYELVATDLTLADFSGALFASDALPTSFSLQDFGSAGVTLSFRDPGTLDFASAEATVTSLTLPEPDGAAAGLAALAALGARARRVRRAPRRSRQGSGHT